MSMKEIVAALMESPYYFTLPLKMRLKEVLVVRMYGDMDDPKKQKIDNQNS